MDDLISRQAVIDTIFAECSSTKLDIDFAKVLILRRAIKALPPVTPQPKMGRWIAYEVRLPDRTILNYRCSVCGRKLIGYNTETLSEAPFCHCGAKMISVADINDEKLSEIPTGSESEDKE